MAKSPNQADQRRYAACRDQHGRVWEGTIEMKSGHYCSPITPKGWNAPVMPPSQYLDLPGDGELRINVNYDRWMADLKEAHKDWENNLRTIARGLYGDKMGEQLLHPSPALLAEVGPKPYPLEPVLACKQGNRWALGFSPDDARGVGQYLAKFTPEPEPDFSDAEVDKWGELEEDVDPYATGGKKVPVGTPHKGK